MNKLVMLMLCFGMVCMLSGDANTDTNRPATNTELPTNASPFQLQNSQMRRVPDSRVLLYSQIPTNSANSYACQLDSVYPFDADLVEDVTPTADWTLDSIVGYVRPWGAWSSWSLVPNVRFLVYADSSIGSHPVDSPFVDIVVNQGTYETTVYGSGWLVGLPLSPSVNLTNGVTYWLEVQPCFSFAANGQTGTMAEPGIGNGVEFFYRFPVLGNPVFVPASAGGWTGCEGGIELYGNPTVSQVTWDFETGWQGWTHTNGAAFPAGWSVEDAQYKSGSGYVCPAPDDSSFWIDSDAAGTGIYVQDTALSPLLTPLSSMDWLWYGWCYNDVGTGDWFEVGIKYFDGSSWTVVPLATYTADNAGSYDSVDVSAYAGYQRVQVYFYFDDADSWAWYAAFDNVTIAATVYVPSDDVGTTAINAPGLVIGPSMTINPTATYENFGTDTENFDVYFVIDSSEANIYNETANITLDSGVDTTISFASWTSGPSDGIVYDVMAYTVFGSDVNPSNDTLAQQTIVSTVGNWIQCTSLPTPEECQATAYDPVNDHIYSFGGTPDGGGAYHNFTYQYDPITDTWATMANMPYAVDWIDASYSADRFYIFGGFDGGSPYTYNMIYDVASDSWSNGASMPLGRMAAGQVVYNDSLIYMLGGYNGSGPSNDVQIYNIYTDAWTTGTALPLVNMMQGVAMTGDTIWLVGGYDGGSAYSTLYYGVIDPGTCETIVWSTGSALPVANFNNGATQLIRGGKWYLYIVGGFENASTITNHAWEYDVELDVWIALPDYPMTITRNDYLIGREGVAEIYVVGGDPTGGWTATDQVWRLPLEVGIAEKPNQSEHAFTFAFAAMANPSKGMISYATSVSGKVVLKAYDGTGRLVETLVNAVQPAGVKTINWDTSNIANGVYFLRLEVQGETATHKLILVK